MFDPLTRPRAQGKPRVLINDGFATHESLELLKFCFEDNIMLGRLHSHTSHKPQPCDVDVFGPLKTAYREQVEQLYRGCADTVGKQHFTLLYSRARDAAFRVRNIRSGWGKTGLYPFNPDVVLHDTQKAQSELASGPILNTYTDTQPCTDLLPTCGFEIAGVDDIAPLLKSYVLQAGSSSTTIYCNSPIFVQL